ncbi:hypothetical protein F1728_01615 [Gimesia benthica]|uniref:Carboxypeptidase regulatory-like domain-containing protein n=1 Tax=Gimesia benthica TaxID=2608982 RepID=A0A6I6A6J5_9PLAN|nr:hypothetical protein [Gimesia benthica]QGQ21470.1 hypothetical protein F1728_01615 [Gimesia benthica]
MNSKQVSLTLCFCLLLPALTGCGSSDEYPRAAVRGIVTLDGDPLSKGVIRFIPDGENEGPQASAPIREGIFNVPVDFGPVIGTNRIEIISTDDGGFPEDDEEAFERMQAVGIKKIEKITVPSQYNKKSKLTKSISAEQDNDFTFALTSTAKK